MIGELMFLCMGVAATKGSLFFEILFQIILGFRAALAFLSTISCVFMARQVKEVFGNMPNKALFTLLPMAVLFFILCGAGFAWSAIAVSFIILVNILFFQTCQ